MRHLARYACSVTTARQPHSPPSPSTLQLGDEMHESESARKDMDETDALLRHSDLSPALQRTIKRKLEAGEDVEGDPEEMEKIIKKMTKKKRDSE